MLIWSMSEILLFTLLVFRMAGLMFLTPFFGSESFPVRVRILFSVLLAFAVFGVMPRQALPVTVGDYFLAVLGELAVGASLGLVSLILFSSIQYAGQLVDQQIGFSLAQSVDPFSNINGTLTGQLQLFLLTLIFLFLNGHLRFLEVFLETVSRVPLGQVHPRIEFMEILIGVLTASFDFALHFAAPLLALSFLINLVLGFISRAVPNMNVLILGFPIKILLGVGLMMVALGQILGKAPDLVRDVITGAEKTTNAFFVTNG